MLLKNGIIKNRQNLLLYIFAPFFATLISLSITHFYFPFNNNIFHIPYVLELNRQPEFSNNTFYQSLNNFTSAIWFILRYISDETNVRTVFFVSNFISRYLAFVGILFFIHKIETKNIKAIAMCISIIALTPLLTGVSSVGEHGLFVSYFTHTEVTWGPIFLSLAALYSEKLSLSAFYAGIIFAINAFVGVWILFISSFTIFYAEIKLKLREFGKSVTTFTLCSLPVIYWIISSSITTPEATEFDYIDYIRSYYPNHFLIEAASIKSLINLSLFYACGLLSVSFFRNKRFLIAIQLACLILFLVGIPLPYLFDYRALYNLHLLRSDGLEQMIAVILSSLAGAKLIFDKGLVKLQVLGLIIVATLILGGDKTFSLLIVFFALFTANFITNQKSVAHEASSLGKKIFSGDFLLILNGLFFIVVLCSDLLSNFSKFYFAQYLFIIFIFYLLYHMQTKNMNSDRNVAIVVLIMGTGIASGYIYKGDKSLVTIDKDWEQITQWIRESDLRGDFLVPVDMSTQFQLKARRPVWGDWKQGAAVMWYPSFYNEWITRFKEVRALKNTTEFINYAEQKKIQNIVVKVMSQNKVCPFPAVLQKANTKYAVCRIQFD